jgi:hypothetical protein
MKSTLVCVHVMPNEIDLFDRWMEQYKKALQYLDDTDDVTLMATLNLSPSLTDWDNSELKQSYFIERFSKAQSVKNINEVISKSGYGTTAQKRDAIKLDYNQFIFIDTDIAFPEQSLKYQLEASYHLDGKYIVLPQIVKLWDDSWDLAVHNDFINKEYNYHLTHNPELTYNQEITEVGLEQINTFKFGCGMHTLYSKELWDLIGIPESFGGYGSEDTFAMYASNYAVRAGINIKQYILTGLYISENMITNRLTDKVKSVANKENSRELSYKQFPDELKKFLIKLENENISNNNI